MGKRLAYSIGGIALVFAVWFIFYITVKNSVIVPSPTFTIKKVGELFTEKFFYSALFSTLLRVVIAFLISAIFAVITASFAYKFNAFANVFGVIVSVMRSLPTLAVLLIILVKVKRTEAPVYVCFLTLFPLLYTAVYSSLKSINTDLEDMCKVYKTPAIKKVRYLYIPSLFPKLYLDFSSAFSFGLKLTVSAEILASVYGSVGGAMQEAAIYDTVMLFALTLVVCVIGIIIEFIGKFAFDIVESKRK
jgi:NitT/TauT family transport system permease protein